MAPSLILHLVSSVQSVIVKGATFKNKIVFQLFELLTQGTYTLGSTLVSCELQLLLCGVHVVNKVEGKCVLLPSQVIWTAAINKVFGEASRIGRFGIARAFVAKKPFGR